MNGIFMIDNLPDMNAKLIFWFSFWIVELMYWIILFNTFFEKEYFIFLSPEKQYIIVKDKENIADYFFCFSH